MSIVVFTVYHYSLGFVFFAFFNGFDPMMNPHQTTIWENTCLLFPSILSKSKLISKVLKATQV